MPSIYTTATFDKWFSDLKDLQGRARIQARIDRAELGNLGDAKPVGEGVVEMRIHVGPGYRVYLTQQGVEIIVLLAGGDKGSQAKDIKAAVKLAHELKDS
jgi:putative addiction module killer protein